MERFLFPNLVYSVTEGPLSDKRMPTAMIYTMNVTEEFCQENYDFTLDSLETVIGNMFTKPYS